jgi:hypothetical protein
MYFFITEASLSLLLFAPFICTEAKAPRAAITAIDNALQIMFLSVNLIKTPTFNL